MRGMLGVRLVAGDGATNGMILVTDKQRGDFTAEDESALRQLAAIGSLGLQQAATRHELEGADQRKSQFLAAPSHELRTRSPLSATPCTSSIARHPEASRQTGRRR